MIVAMPTGIAHGWGIAGQHLIEEIYKLPIIPDVTLHSINNPDFAPTFPEQWNKVNIGYCFFENDIEAYRHLKNAAPKWDFIVAGSHFCEYHLRLWGINNTGTILQGVDPKDFYAANPRNDDGRFVVFSGGKFELRKSQDIVIAAMKVFMDRHKDVWFSAAWHNQWLFSVATMVGSTIIDFAMSDDSCEAIYLRTLAENGIDLSRVTLHPMLPNGSMREIYANSDIGIFPNRCEGGNNMVMSEYMACGRTVVASDKTGHADVITDYNAFVLTDYLPQLVERNGVASAIWFEPSVEETIEQLEYAYQNRDLIAAKEKQAASDLRQLEWSKAAQSFYDIALNLTPDKSPTTAADYAQRANGLNAAGRPDMALSQLLLASELAPFDTYLHLKIASLYESLGQTHAAHAHRNKADSLAQFSRS